MKNVNEDIILEFKHISKHFPGVKALDDISFKVKRGSIHCLIGENGAGKSTLMKVINGMYKPDGGDIEFDRKVWSPKSSAQARLQGIAMIHQELNIIPEMTILQNMYLGKELFQKNRIILDDKKMEEDAREFLARQGFSYDLNTKMKDISLADAQMIEIIKAISCNAKIILMDEPTSSLTEKEVQYLIERIFPIKWRRYLKLQMKFQFLGMESILFPGRSVISQGPQLLKRWLAGK